MHRFSVFASAAAVDTVLPCSACASRNRRAGLMVVFAFLLDTEGLHFIECNMCNPPRPQGHHG